MKIKALVEDEDGLDEWASNEYNVIISKMKKQYV